MRCHHRWRTLEMPPEIAAKLAEAAQAARLLQSCRRGWSMNVGRKRTLRPDLPPGLIFDSEWQTYHFVARAAASACMFRSARSAAMPRSRPTGRSSARKRRMRGLAR